MDWTALAVKKTLSYVRSIGPEFWIGTCAQLISCLSERAELEVN